jgi:RNA polymerase sigma factor (sigma-70 family)
MTTDDQGSVTRWLGGAKASDETAARELWRRYFESLVRLARARLRSSPRTAEDEEDVALSAFDSFCRAAEQGRFPRLEDRGDLWQILIVLTARKAADLVEHEGRGKRDWRRAEDRNEDVGPELLELVGREPDPAFAAQVAEQCHRLLGHLGDDELRAVALGKMEGYTNEEIAEQLGCAPATVERRLRLIRKRWQKEAGPPG